MRIPIVAVVGPTASGKTALSVELALRLDGEIISADSMQVYRGMDIASAKPTADEMRGVPHHLIDCLDPSENYSVARFCEMAHPIAEQIAARGHLPILVGGTGLFVDSFLNNVDFSENTYDPVLREQLSRELEQNGVDAMLSQIRSFDPASYARLSEGRNPRRILRCIEVYRLTGRTQTELNAQAADTPARYDAVRIGLKTADRRYLYERINARVDDMAARGLVDEARAFLSRDLSDTASMAIGCKELRPYFDHGVPLEICIEELKKQTRRYAKRQLTWFLRDDAITWFDIDIASGDDILAACLALTEGHFHERK